MMLISANHCIKKRLRIGVLSLGVLLLLVLVSGCERDGAVPVASPVTVATPDNFAQYINQSAALPAGRYKIVAASYFSGVTSDYTLTISSGDTVATLQGSWANSIGRNPDLTLHAAADVHEFELTSAGGIDITLAAEGVETFVYLFDRNDNLLYDSDSVYPGITTPGATVYSVSIKLDPTIAESAAYAQSYYQAIDPNSERDTLYKWRTANCFTNDPDTQYGADIHVIFRDTKDLGYGRNMFWKFGCDGNGNDDTQNGAMAVFVENFNVELVPDFPYSTLNLDAAIENDRQFHFGTNAIEYNDWTGNGPAAYKFNKFYTFKPVSQALDADQTRLDVVDLDNRGDKAMPVPCIFCHGGDALPLDPDGRYPIHPLTAIRGDTNSKLQILEVDELEFVGSGQYSRMSQETLLKTINQAVYCTYPTDTPTNFCTTGDLASGNYGVTFPQADVTLLPQAAGHWQGNFLRELVEGWYGGAEFPNAAFDSSTFVPAGWQPTAQYPDADDLFLSVIKPTCLVCHARRGSDLASNGSAGVGQDIDFSTFDKFLVDQAQIEDYVFDRGLMPLSLLGYETFWESNQPDILATYMTAGFDNFDDQGVIQPGAPLADAGPDRVVNVPVTLSGEGSVFADQFSWQVSSAPAGASYTLSRATSNRPILDTDTDGVYVIDLFARNGLKFDTDTVTITVDSSLPVPADLRFTDIDDIITATGYTHQTCLNCHSDTDAAAGVQGLISGIPVVWDGSDASGISAYRRVLSRVNLKDPAESLFLSKPAGIHHNGGTVLDQTTSDGVAAYNIILSWIIEGAIE